MVIMTLVSQQSVLPAINLHKPVFPFQSNYLSMKFQILLGKHQSEIVIASHVQKGLKKLW